MMYNVGVEWLRAVSIVCVVCLHCLRPYFVAEKAPFAWEEALRVVLDCATPSFFFVSGFLLPRRPGGLRKRMVRVALPYSVASGARFALECAYWRTRGEFWRELQRELSLTHLGPTPFPDDCVLHEKLAPLEALFQYDARGPSAREIARRLLVGAAFGHYYFVPVLLQMQVIAHYVFQARGDRFLAQATAALALWHPFRSYVVGAFCQGAVAWRLPFLWLFYFVFGFYAKHGMRRAAKPTQRALLFAFAACLAAFAGASCVAQAAVASSTTTSAFWRVVGLFFKDVYVVALPAAVCLFFAPPHHDDDGSTGLVVGATSSSEEDVTTCPLAKPATFLRAELARFSYTIYLYHGFFLGRDWLPCQPWYVLGATVVLCSLIELLTTRPVSTKLFGISPPPSSSSSSDTPAPSSSPSSSATIPPPRKPDLPA
mmetsp:Transcript_30685/g.93795  ORF Transcript_30685/g.93795 Transcript_30685/m.93795 type:complete len:428 (-) Transcript_30685:62-1345(-)